MKLCIKRVLKVYIALSIILNPAIGFSNQSAGKMPRCEHIFITNSLFDNSPWGLKFLNSENDFFKKNFPTTIGIEIEGAIPVEITYSDVTKKVAEVLASNSEFKNIKVFIPFEFESYRKHEVTFKYKGNKYKYVVTNDVSINPGVHYRDIEINSPILRHPEDFETFNIVLETLKKELSLTAVPQSAGVHIHVGFPEASSQELAFLAQLFSGIEEHAISHFKMMRSRSYYTKKTDQELKKYLQDISRDLVTTDDIIEAQGTRYHALNFHSLKKYGTVEFRLFNSTIEGSQVDAYINFSRGLVEATRRQDPRLIEFLKDNQDQKQLNLVDLAKALNLEIGNPTTFNKNIEIFEKLMRDRRGRSSIHEAPQTDISQISESFWSKENLAEFARVFFLSNLIGAIAYQITGDDGKVK